MEVKTAYLVSIKLIMIHNLVFGFAEDNVDGLIKDFISTVLQ